jgi:hypothetical protein
MLDEIIDVQQEAKWRSKITPAVAVAIGAPITIKSNHPKVNASSALPNAPPKGYPARFLQLSKADVTVIAAALTNDITRTNGVPLNMVWDLISGRNRMDILPDIKRKIMGWRDRLWALCVPSSTEPIIFTIASTQASHWADDDISAHDSSHDIIMVVPKHARVTLTTLSIDNENTDNDWSTNDLRTQLLFISHD